MKISEKLSEIKRKEGEVQRLITLRETIVDDTFRESVTITEGMPAEKIDELKAKFMVDKKARFDEATLEIEKLIKEIIAAKNQINKKNLANGIDAKLLEIKYIRMELARLMTYMRKYEYSSSRRNMLDYNTMIKKLEDKKSRLDAEIQFINWNTEY